MRLTHLTLRNWRNFKQADFDMQDRMFVIGPTHRASPICWTRCGFSGRSRHPAAASKTR